jgi:hypothetical protein
MPTIDLSGDSGERKRIPDPITIDRCLQTVGGILLMICAALCCWAWSRIEGHEGRIIRIETQVDGIGATLKEIKEDTKEIKIKLEQPRKP